MRMPRPLYRSACDELYHFTNALLMAYEKPDLMSSGAMLQAASISVTNRS